MKVILTNPVIYENNIYHVGETVDFPPYFAKNLIKAGNAKRSKSEPPTPKKEAKEK
jgi:hypothetical protein